MNNINDLCIRGGIHDEGITLKLKVPEEPTIKDMVLAYRTQLLEQVEIAEKSIFDAELDVANAQRIAVATRAKAARLRDGLDALDTQIKALLITVQPESGEI
jgi:hypothetical protein